MLHEHKGLELVRKDGGSFPIYMAGSGIAAALLSLIALSSAWQAASSFAMGSMPGAAMYAAIGIFCGAFGAHFARMFLGCLREAGQKKEHAP